VRKLKFIAALIWSLTILVVCLLNTKNISKLNIPFLGYDKMVHAGIHFVLTVLWLLYLETICKLSTKIYLSVGLLLLCYGVLIEILQETLTKDRSADLFDVIANTVGIILAIQTFLIFRRFKKI